MKMGTRITKIETAISAMNLKESGIVCFCAATDAEYKRKIDDYEKENPLEANVGPGPSRIYLRIRRAEPDLEHERS